MFLFNVVSCLTGKSFGQVKTESDSNSIAVHPHNDEPRQYLCTVCNERFVTKSCLNFHRRKHKTQEIANWLLCFVCEKRFSSRSALNQHINIHTGKYRCPECDKCCYSKSHLAVHRRSHSGEKPFECVVCSKGFPTLSDLARHSRTHAGDVIEMSHVWQGF